MNTLEMGRWVNTTGRQLQQGNTYVYYEAEVPYHIRVRYSYKQIATYTNEGHSLTVYDLPVSNPRCYYVTLSWKDNHNLTERFNAYIDARTILAFLVRFNWRLNWSQIRSSFEMCIPERMIKAITYPLWFSKITLDLQTIWYTTHIPNELYMEILLWTADGTPVVEDYKFFENVGSTVLELYN